MSAQSRSYQVQTNGYLFAAEVREEGGALEVRLDGQAREVRLRSVDGRHHYTVLSAGELVEAYVEEMGDHYVIHLAGNVFEVAVEPQRATRPQTVQPLRPSAGEAVVKAPMPGLVLQVAVEPGQQVTKGAVLLVLEAMKMENDLRAPRDGVVKRLDVRPGQKVNQGQTLAVIG